MLALLSWFAQAIFLVVVLCFALYVLLELRVLLISRRAERRKLAELVHPVGKTDDADWPPVSVLLPICNESAVVERLIDAACRLRYPSGALEILVLDDSSDETSGLAQAKVDHYAAQGIPIRRIRREGREGYKAGNLVNGMEQAAGAFFAIFDADFVPPEEFLLKTIVCFKDPRLGFLQTGIGYENRDKSFLTRFHRDRGRGFGLSSAMWGLEVRLLARGGVDVALARDGKRVSRATRALGAWIDTQRLQTRAQDAGAAHAADEAGTCLGDDVFITALGGCLCRVLVDLATAFSGRFRETLG